jgi:asparagine synthase (glutamine-hydrolysing)
MLPSRRLSPIMSGSLIHNAHTALRLAEVSVTSPRLFRVLLQVRRHKMTYLAYDALLDLMNSVQQVEDHEIEGIAIEAGCALGGSAIVMAAAKQMKRPLFVYDVFGMIPPPSTSDGEDAASRYNAIVAGQSAGINGDTYYGYQGNLKQKVLDNFSSLDYEVAQHQVALVQGLYEETLHPDQPVAIAHLDCDWYDSVMVCLQRIVPRLSQGGRLIIDDYDHWDGCRKAIDEYFASQKKHAFTFERKSRLHIVRVA